jgi:hypothetical protein
MQGYILNNYTNLNKKTKNCKYLSIWDVSIEGGWEQEDRCNYLAEDDPGFSLAIRNKAKFL